MAGIDKIKESILDEANKKANQIKSDAQAQAAAMIQAAQQKADERKLGIIEKAKAEVAQIEKRVHAAATLDSKKDRQKNRQGVVEQVFSATLDKLCNLPREQYIETAATMAAKLIETGKEEVVLSAKDRSEIGQQLVDRINQKINAGTVTLAADSANIKGGFLLRSGNIEINSSFETIIRMKKDQLEAEVYKMLFGGSKEG